MSNEVAAIVIYSQSLPFQSSVVGSQDMLIERGVDDILYREKLAKEMICASRMYTVERILVYDVVGALFDVSIIVYTSTLENPEAL